MPTPTLPRGLIFRKDIWRPALALLGGALGGLSYPTFNLWPAIFASLALSFIAIHNVGFWRAFRLGLISGLSFYLSGIYWLSLYLGPEPLLALSVLESIIYAFGFALTAFTWRHLQSNSIRSIALQCFAIASIWSLREWVSTHLPYEGFPWLRAAQALSDSYLSKWVFLGGISWLSFITAWVSAIIALAFIHRKRLQKSRRFLTLVSATCAITFVTPVFINPPVNRDAGSIRIAGIQGNANAGLFSNERWGSILENHLRQTNRLLNTSAGKSADLVVWPENAADISPLDYPQSASKINELVNRMQKPLILGTQRNQGSKVYNSSVLWIPGLGPAAIYDKKRPVPFAEYVPDRQFWYALAPNLIGLIHRGFSVGTRSGIFRLTEGRLGVLICFEIAVDEINRDLVAQGAQAIISQTNNADFGRSAETYQQAALARLQAISTGRAVVNVSTVGVSALFLPDGSVQKQLPAFKAASFVAEVPLTNKTTPAQALGVYLELAVNLLALLLSLLALLKMLRRRRDADA